MKYALLGLAIFAAGPARADLVENSVVSTAYPGVVQIENGEGLYCTGEVVGMHPTTILTAAHCLLEDFRAFRGQDPTATYTMSAGPKDDPHDIAVLVYANVDLSATLAPADVFSVAPVALGLAESIDICGFGMTTNVPNEGDESDVLRCGRNRLGAVNGTYVPVTSAVAPFGAVDLKAIQDFMLENGTKAENLIVTIADGATLGPGYDQMVMINSGDSGGPWFTQDAQGLHLAGVSSWGTQLHGILATSVALRLSSNGAKLTLSHAVTQVGADIRGIAELTASDAE